MPILALPVVDEVPTYPAGDLSKQDSRTLTLRSLDGVYPLPATGREFFFLPDIEGIDMPPRELITDSVPGMEGERLREVRIGSREVVLPLWVAADSTHLQYLERRDILAQLFNYRTVSFAERDGTLDLVAESARGQRTLRCVYVDGMTGSLWPNEGSYWAKLNIVMRAVRPYWSGPFWRSPEIRLPVPVPWFGAFPGGLTSSYALGADVTIAVEGDVESWPEVTVTGPCSEATIMGPGITISIPDGLLAGETAIIRTDPRERTALFNDVKDWSRIAPQTQWTAVVPGDRIFNVLVLDATADTSAVIQGRSRYERPW